MKKNNDGREEARAGVSRRAELLEAAARLMREKGYSATTTREMAEAVGMCSGSPFCHFRNKDEILLEIAVRGMEQLLEKTERLMRRRMSAHRRLHELIRLHAEVLHGPDGDFPVVMLREWYVLAPASRRRLAELMNRYEAIWRDCLKKVRGAKHLSADAGLSARLILGSLNWTLHWFRRDGTMSRRELADAAAALFFTEPPTQRDAPRPA
jgi:AcrR family transcriptional regulator